MPWNIDFISEDEFREHVSKTIEQYASKFVPTDLDRFNSNIVDPIKLLFDKSVYRKSWSTVIEDEISRQRDKSVNNSIGYFHQNLFSYLDGCIVPKEGWDVIYRNDNGITVSDGAGTVHTCYVEMKNKHNTMNSASSAKTYMKMQNQLLKDDDCVCCLVEAIAKQSQDIVWKASVDGQSVRHRLIRRVSLDRFYELVTGDPDAFFKICMALPNMINEILGQTRDAVLPHDSAHQELLHIANQLNIPDEELAQTVAVYMLGFGSYNGFSSL